MITQGEIKRDGVWQPIGFAEAVDLRSKGKIAVRCPRCHGAISPYDGGGARAHFGHIVAHGGCSVTPPVSHPDALA